MTSSIVLSIFLLTSAPETSPPKPSILVSVQSLKWIIQELYPDENIAVICPPGNSPHTFELKPENLKKASRARFALSVDKEYDAWFDKLGIKKQARALDLLPAAFIQKPEFEKYHHDHEGHDHQKHDHHHGSRDPHFWMNPLAVVALLKPLVKQICSWEPTDCARVEARSKDFSSRLISLDQQIQALMLPVKGKPFLSSHDGFGYFVRRYQLDYLEPLEPLPGQEPSPKDIQRILKNASSKGVLTIFGEIQLPTAPVEALAQATKIKVEILDQYGAEAHIKNYRDLLLDTAQKIKKGLGPVGP